MSKAQDDHVLPRPVEKLPEYAKAPARRSLVERLVAAFGMSEAAATTISNAVVDPTAVRKAIGDDAAPRVEEIAVPGGVLWAIRTQVWARRIMPDARNPRIGPSRRHPFAVDPGVGGEESRFRPVPEPRTPDDQPDTTPELTIDLESREHLTWASSLAKTYVLAENNWKSSIESQGVMEAVWLVPTTYRHADGTVPATALTTAEGSSRITAAHDILRVRSADVPYEDDDRKLRETLKKLNEAFDRGTSAEQAIQLRCERVPALVLVGFKKHAGCQTGFPTAVKSLVALRHVEPPTPWGEGPANEALADEALDEFYRRELISATERAYFAGACTKAEARAAHLRDDATVRAARIVELFAAVDERRIEALRVAVTSQSTRKRVTPKLRNELATALIVRSVTGDAGKTDQVRRYLRHAFAMAVHKEPWSGTNREPEVLLKEALAEIAQMVGEGSNEPGPASLELAVRAAYALVVQGRLGGNSRDMPDRRTPGEVLDTMRRKPHGARQLAQALRDFMDDRHIRAVDEAGNVVRRADGADDQVVTDVLLRDLFPPPGKGGSTRPGDQPTDVLHNRFVAFGQAVEKLAASFDEIGKVLSNGTPLVESCGRDPRDCDAWRDALKKIDDELTYWARTYRKTRGTMAPTSAPADEEDEADDFDAAFDESTSDHTDEA